MLVSLKSLIFFVILIKCILSIEISKLKLTENKSKLKIDLNYKTLINNNNGSAYLPYLNYRDKPYTVSWDKRSLIINSVDRILIQSGSLHYPRIHYSEWLNVIKLAKSTGINTIDCYVFWAYHELLPNIYDFESENRNILKWFDLLKSEGLFVLLRIGPYVDAEYNYGGLPIWLRHSNFTGIIYRTLNPQWLVQMQKFVEIILKLINPYLAENGGNIFMLQIENEYGNVESTYGNLGYEYMLWSTIMAQSICNKFGIWTENWIGSPGWTGWNNGKPHRPIQDFTYAITAFIAASGGMYNTYMLYGGTNYERMQSQGHTVTYSFDPPILEIQIPNPKHFTHYKNLVQTINYYVPALLANGNIIDPIIINLNISIYEYGNSVTFILNSGMENQSISYKNNDYLIWAWSALIIDGQTLNIVFNSADLSDNIPPVITKQFNFTEFESIQFYPETKLMEIKNYDFIISTQLLEQISVTDDKSDYLIYSTIITFTKAQVENQSVLLTIPLYNEAFYVYLNGTFLDSKFSFQDRQYELNLNLTNIKNLQSNVSYELQFISLTMGLPPYGTFLEQSLRGIAVKPTDKIFLDNTLLNDGNRLWIHSAGLVGEINHFYNSSKSDELKWLNYSEYSNSTLNWFKLTFRTPTNIITDSDNLYQLNMMGMTRGWLYLNDHILSRYWTIVADNKTNPCDEICDYRGSYTPAKCRFDCLKPQQILYHFPKEWLTQDRNQLNQLILFEEGIADPTKIFISITAVNNNENIMKDIVE
ncbi:unnamed protein product [Didymodactylos carnosus]|uniref:Beta-galactosidase n=1 Tax=Didymodactylos carnosus TaxID=1234261 RepID=A0A8S2Q7P5_9BILA|nr:unnamed protein product [Didymodactylos carnosus]CAF4087383.1 unnamed protein product [Didymodactylos carnosus]